MHQDRVFLWILQHWFVLNIWVVWREILQILLFMATNMTDISWGGLILKFKLENFPFLIKIYLFRASNFSKMLHNPENPLIIKWNLFILSSSLPNFNQDVSARPGRQMSTPCRVETRGEYSAKINELSKKKSWKKRNFCNFRQFIFY